MMIIILIIIACAALLFLFVVFRALRKYLDSSDGPEFEVDDNDDIQPSYLVGQTRSKTIAI